ncbi:Serine-threonine kinase receptor-associated protein, partial [Intoshia linei]
MFFSDFYLPVNCSGHIKSVTDISFNGDKVNPLMVSSSMDGRTFLRNGKTGDWIHSYVNKYPVWSAKLNKSGRYVYVCDGDSTLKIYDNKSFKLSNTLKCKKSYFNVCDVKNDIVAASAKNECIYIYDSKSGKTIKTFDHKDYVNNVKWISNYNNLTPDSSCVDLLFSCSNETVRIWSLKTMKEIECWKYQTSCKIAYNLDKNIMATLNNCDVELLNLKGMKKISSYSVPSSSGHLSPNINCICIDSQAEYLICGTDLKNLYKIFLKQEGRIECIMGHTTEVTCCEFSPDGHVIASGSNDGMVKLWQNNPGENYGLWKVESHNKFSSYYRPKLESTMFQLSGSELNFVSQKVITNKLIARELLTVESVGAGKVICQGTVILEITVEGKILPVRMKFLYDYNCTLYIKQHRLEFGVTNVFTDIGKKPMITEMCTGVSECY